MSLDTEAPLAAKSVVSISYMVLAIGGITANLIILFTFLRERRRSYFHVQLALANILYLTSLALAAPSALRGRWMFGDTWCQLFAVQVYFAGYAKFALVAVVSVECYAAVCFKTWYERLSDQSYAFVSGLIWLYSLVFGLAPYFGWSSYGYEEGGGSSCGLTLDRTGSTHNSYIWASSGSLVILMLLALVSLVHAFRESRTDESEFSPLFNDRELVKICSSLFALCLVASVFYAYRVATAAARRPNTLGFLGIELSHLLLKMDAACCPLVYLLFSKFFSDQAHCLITGTDPEKKDK